MKTATIVFETDIDAGTLVRDALREFIGARTPVVDYIAKRYGTHDAAFRERKETEVLKRIEAARHALDTMTTRVE